MFAKFSDIEKNRRTVGPIVCVEFPYRQKDGYEIHCDVRDATVKRTFIRERRYSSVSIVIRLRAERQSNGGSVPGRRKNIFSSLHLADSLQCPCAGLLLRRYNSRGANLTIGVENLTVVPPHEWTWSRVSFSTGSRWSCHILAWLNIKKIFIKTVYFWHVVEQVMDV